MVGTGDTPCIRKQTPLFLTLRGKRNSLPYPQAVPSGLLEVSHTVTVVEDTKGGEP
jgi:hypothetical protein